MDCRNPNCDGRLSFLATNCKQCRTPRLKPVQRTGDTRKEVFPLNVDGIWVKPAGNMGESHKSSGHSENTMAVGKKRSTTSTQAHEKPSSLRWLPVAFYIIASLGFLGWIIIALNLVSWVAFGYGVGSTIACFAGGRTIELLQNIDDELYRKRMSD